MVRPIFNSPTIKELKVHILRMEFKLRSLYMSLATYTSLGLITPFIKHLLSHYLINTVRLWDDLLLKHTESIKFPNTSSSVKPWL